MTVWRITHEENPVEEAEVDAEGAEAEGGEKMKQFVFAWFPWPPSVNHYWGQNGKRKFIMEPGLCYRQNVALLLRYEKPFPAESRLFITIDAYPPDKRRRDLDNTLKATFDAIQHAGIVPDDNQFDAIQIKRKKVVPGGKMFVTIGLVFPCASSE